MFFPEPLSFVSVPRACLCGGFMHLVLRIGKAWILFSDGQFGVFYGHKQLIGGELLFSYQEHYYWVQLAYARYLPRDPDELPFS